MVLLHLSSSMMVTCLVASSEDASILGGLDHGSGHVD